MSYKAVVFDLDGTLVESHIDYEKMSEQIKQLLERMGMTEHIENRRAKGEELDLESPLVAV
ncbi:hypothetical protein ACFL0D_09160, partial [Thermoproteota archaeon]